MIRKPITVRAEEGLDARPIALLVQEANQYASKVYVEFQNKKINAKSIIGLPDCARGYEGIAQQYLFHYARTTGLGTV